MERLNLKYAPKAPVTQLLELSNWCEDMTAVQIEKLAPYFIPYLADVDTIMLKEGEVSDFFAIICEGSVSIMKEDRSGKAKKIHEMGVGKAFGELAFFDSGPCSASVVVQNQATLLIMDRKNFKTLKNAIPHLALVITLKLIVILGQRLRQTTGKLVDLI